MRLRIVVMFLALPLVLVAVRVDAQVRREVISGRVSVDSNRSVVGATVSVTRAPDRALFQVLTDTAGRFRLVIDSGTGDYLVHVSARSSDARPPFRKRVTRERVGDSLYVVDVVLRDELRPPVLGTVRVQARRPRVERDPDSFGSSAGGGEQLAIGVAAAVAPADKGDLSGLAASLPGISAAGSGFSVLGLGSDQNVVTMNGLSFVGASLPRDAQYSVRVATSAFDPSRGWFGGAETRVDLQAGSLFALRSGSLTFDSPALQQTDAAGASLDARFGTLTLGTGASGLTAHDRLAFNYGFQVSQRNADAPDFLNASASALRVLGVSTDSLARLRATLAAFGLNQPASSPTDQQLRRVSFVTRLNTPEVSPITFDDASRSSGVIFYLFDERATNAGASPFNTIQTATGHHRSVAVLQGVHSVIPRPELLADFRGSITFANDEPSINSLMPFGLITLRSGQPDGSITTTALGVGGSRRTSQPVRTASWELQGDIKGIVPQWATHRLRVTADARVDLVDSGVGQGDRGTFSFPNLDAFAAGRASAFQRTLAGTDARSAAANAFVALGDLWRPSRTFSMMYGLRAEASQFFTVLESNDALQRLIGEDNRAIPNTMHLSPRVGFTWTYAKSPRGNLIRSSSIGQLQTPALGVLRGGFGEFRSFLPASLEVPAIAGSRAGGLSRTIRCLGAAVPQIDWRGFARDSANIPSDCSSNGGSSESPVPDVALLGRGFDASRSWRGNLTWTSHLGNIVWAIDGTLSWNVNQPSFTDANFTSTGSFFSADEGRAIFVPVGAINTSTGLVDILAARKNGAFGRVLVQRSDARSEARQLTVSIAPMLALTPQRFYSSLSYTFSDVRTHVRGRDATVFSAPDAFSWSRADGASRHAFILQAGAEFGGTSVSLFGRLSSGIAYTPILGADVNGDGAVNDRAFVFDPARTTDAALAQGMRTLLATAPPEAGACLRRFLGKAVDGGGCEGPWSAQLNARVAFNTKSWGRLGERATVSLYFANVLSGLDALMHGDALRGWGSTTAPDPVLYSVTGFDPSTARFRYLANPRFGTTSPSQTTNRAPFRVTLSIQLDLGQPVIEQQLTRYLQPGRRGYPGKRLTAEELKTRYQRSATDPYQLIFSESDSLLLSPDQVRALLEAQQRYHATTDSIWLDLAGYLAGLPDRYDATEALRRHVLAIDAAWEAARLSIRAEAPKLLTTLQLRLLPSFAGTLLRAEQPIHGPRNLVFGF